MAYLDRITFSPVLPEAAETVNRYLKIPGLNPQSPTRMGAQAKQALEEARRQVAALISADPQEILLVSTGTESVNLGLGGLARSAARSKRNRTVIVSAIEHVSVMQTARALEKEGFTIITVPVDGTGAIDAGSYLDALKKDALVASVQMANPEIGTIQNIRYLAEKAHETGVLFHTDAVDAAGWLPVDAASLQVDALSFSGVQFGGPPGAAALYVRKGVSLLPLFHGGLQERHRRPGLENIPAIAGFGVAADHALKTLGKRMDTALRHAAELREILLKIDAVQLTGDAVDRIPGHVSSLIRCVEGEALLLMLDMKNIQAASGSSCTAKDLKISPVLTAMGIEHADAQGSLVFSTCEQTTDADITLVKEELPRIVQRLRDMSPLWARR